VLARAVASGVEDVATDGLALHLLVSMRRRRPGESRERRLKVVRYGRRDRALSDELAPCERRGGSLQRGDRLLWLRPGAVVASAKGSSS